MEYYAHETVLVESHTSRDNTINILSSDKCYFVLDLKGLFPCKDFKTLSKCYDYIHITYGKKVS